MSEAEGNLQQHCNMHIIITVGEDLFNLWNEHLLFVGMQNNSVNTSIPFFRKSKKLWYLRGCRTHMAVEGDNHNKAGFDSQEKARHFRYEGSGSY